MREVAVHIPTGKLCAPLSLRAQLRGPVWPRRDPAGRGRQRGTCRRRLCQLAPWMGGSRPGRTQFRKVLPAIPAHGGGDGAGQPTISVGELRQKNLLMLPTYV
eukprot:scaffold1222_cov138-Isochrysis_galbana.AAC.3